MSSAGIIVGFDLAPGMPPDRLTPPELAELHKLLEAHQDTAAQLKALEQRLELLIIGARDRRGLSGRVHVDPGSGAIGPFNQEVEDDQSV